MRFEFLLFSADPVVIRRCCFDGGVDGVIVDWENRGKTERQSGFDTQINALTVQDLRLARMATPATHRLFCRINGWNAAKSRREIADAIDNGADELFLPMVRSARDVEKALEAIDNRVPLGILIETRDAVEAARELCELPISRVYVGLNDLAIDTGASSLFDALHNGLVDRIRESVPASMPFGVAGMTLPEFGSPIPARLLAGEIARLGASFTFLRRSFLRDIEGRDPQREIPAMHGAIASAISREPRAIADDHAEFRQAALLAKAPLLWRTAAV